MDAGRLEDLLEKYVENELSDGERTELESLLKTSPDACRRFWACLQQHALLRRLMAESEGRALAHAESRRSGTRRGVFIAAASVLVALGLGAVLWGLRAPSNPDPAPGFRVAEKPAARPAPEEPPKPRVEEPPALPPRPPKSPDPSPMPAPPQPPPPAEKPLRPEPAPPPEPKAPEPTPPAPEPPRPSPAGPKETVLVFGRIERASGEVAIPGAGRARAGQDLVSGQGLEVPGREGYAVLKCPDGSRLELGPSTRVREFRDEAGKRIVLDRGLLTVDAVKQPAGRPMVLVTPHAEARVLGTRLVLWALADASRVEVREGRVRVTRREDNVSADVSSDQQAVVARGIPLAAKPARVTDDLVALYRFDTGPVDVVRDVSGAGPPLDLEFKGDGVLAWKPTGLSIQRYARIASHGPAAKVIQACRKSREITVEAWVVPDKTSFRYQGWLVLLGDYAAPNVALMQGVSTPAAGPYLAQLRTSAPDAAGHPALASPKNLVEARPAHVVFVRAAGGQERLYVNGLPRASGGRAGDFSAWADDARLSIGLEWLGEYRLVALYSRALKDAEVVRNFKLGLE